MRLTDNTKIVKVHISSLPCWFGSDQAHPTIFFLLLLFLLISQSRNDILSSKKNVVAALHNCCSGPALRNSGALRRRPDHPSCDRSKLLLRNMPSDSQRIRCLRHRSLHTTPQSRGDVSQSSPGMRQHCRLQRQSVHDNDSTRLHSCLRLVLQATRWKRAASVLHRSLRLCDAAGNLEHGLQLHVRWVLELASSPIQWMLYRSAQPRYLDVRRGERCRVQHA